MDNYILLKDVELHGHKYRFAIFEEQEKYYTAFAEIFEEDSFELIHGGQFKTLVEAEKGLKDLVNFFVGVEN